MKKQKFIKPDYASSNECFAGGSKLEDAPHPIQRKWPTSKQKRMVKVQIITYDFGGHHYFVSITEEGNPIWDGKEYWTHYPDDNEYRGRDTFDFIDDIKHIPFDANPFHYNDYHNARLAATTILDKYFDDGHYEIDWSDYTGEDVDGWCYVGKHGE